VILENTLRKNRGRNPSSDIKERYFSRNNQEKDQNPIGLHMMWEREEERPPCAEGHEENKKFFRKQRLHSSGFS